MYPFVKPSKTKYTHGHQGKAEYRVHYYQSSFSRAIDQPPPDFLFKTRLVGDTYTNKVEGGEMQIWVRDIECDWTPAAEEHEHPYLTPPGKSDPYVLHVRDDEYAAWIKPESLKMMKARKAREVRRVRAVPDSTSSSYY